jgi:hypothetical protein
MHCLPHGLSCVCVCGRERVGVCWDSAADNTTGGCRRQTSKSNLRIVSQTATCTVVHPTTGRQKTCYQDTSIFNVTLQMPAGHQHY